MSELKSKIRTDHVLTLRSANPVKWLVLVGLFMATNISLSSFGIPVPGGHLYLCDTAINTAAILMDPVAALLVGGIGSFLGDFIFYPTPMFVSLVTHGLQAYVVSRIVHSGDQDDKSLFRRSLIATLIGSAIMVAGYTFGKAFIYATPEVALVKLPYEIAQGLLGVAGSLLLCFQGRLIKIFRRFELQ